MDRGILSRLEALEAMEPAAVIIQAQNATGKQFECTVAEYLKHDNLVECAYPNGQKYIGREWAFIRMVSGNNMKEVREILESIPSAF